MPDDLFKHVVNYMNSHCCQVISGVGCRTQAQEMSFVQLSFQSQLLGYRPHIVVHLSAGDMGAESVLGPGRGITARATFACMQSVAKASLPTMNPAVFDGLRRRDPSGQRYWQAAAARRSNGASEGAEEDSTVRAPYEAPWLGPASRPRPAKYWHCYSTVMNCLVRLYKCSCGCEIQYGTRASSVWAPFGSESRAAT